MSQFFPAGQSSGFDLKIFWAFYDLISFEISSEITMQIIQDTMQINWVWQRRID